MKGQQKKKKEKRSSQLRNEFQRNSIDAKASYELFDMYLQTALPPPSP